MKHWSNLQKALYGIISPDMDFQIHCVAYPMRSKSGWGHESVPRCWITIGKEIVWDFPKCCPQEQLDKMYYPYCGNLSFISQTIRDYIDCPRNELLTFDEEDRHWGLLPILKVCDHRIGKRRLREMHTDNPIVRQIIALRLRE